MNLFHRISVCFVVCCSVACSKSDADLPVPAAEPETVVIGCATAGADMEVRTQIDDDLSVRWVSGDEIRLWAREHGAADFLSEVRNTPFRFDYYSPQWSRAGFTGTISGLASAFDAERTYDYFAVSPAPASDSDVAGTAVAYDIPSVQTGKFDGRYDILTAQLENAAALKKGDNNPSINLKFRHHVHVMKFTVPQNALGEKIRVVELIFPQPVVGRMTVDATGAVADDLSGIDCDKVSVEFPKGEELDAGDTFFVTIAPATFDAGTQIGMRIIGTTGETSVDYTFPLPKVCEAQHLTPVELHVPAKNTFYTVVKFKITDNDRPECAGKENLFGVNTLGERVHTVRLVGQTGAFANAVRMSNGCSASDDGSVLTCAIPDDAAFDGVCEMMFVSKKLEGSKCPWSAWDSSALSGRTLEVEYESERALIKSQDGWTFARATAPVIRDGEINSLSTLSIPYLFFENFSQSSGEGCINKNNTAYMLDGYSPYTNGWSAARFEISSNVAFCMAAYLASSWVSNPDKGDNHRGRLTTAFLPLKTTAAIQVSYRVAGTRQKAKLSNDYTYATYELGLDTASGAIKGEDTALAVVALSESSKDGDISYNGDYTVNLRERMVIIPDCTSAHRVSWRSSFVTEGGMAITVYIYLDDIKVQLAPKN